MALFPFLARVFRRCCFFFYRSIISIIFLLVANAFKQQRNSIILNHKYTYNTTKAFNSPSFKNKNKIKKEVWKVEIVHKLCAHGWLRGRFHLIHKHTFTHTHTWTILIYNIHAVQVYSLLCERGIDSTTI